MGSNMDSGSNKDSGLNVVHCTTPINKNGYLLNSTAELQNEMSFYLCVVGSERVISVFLEGTTRGYVDENIT